VTLFIQIFFLNWRQLFIAEEKEIEDCSILKIETDSTFNEEKVFEKKPDMQINRKCNSDKNYLSLEERTKIVKDFKGGDETANLLYLYPPVCPPQNKDAIRIRVENNENND
jgi:predicted nucleic acid binding AN1-type Zn finger protein